MINTRSAPSRSQVANATPRVFVYPNNSKDDRIDLSSDVIAFTATNGVRSPVGTFEITLVARQGTEHWLGRIEGAPTLLSTIRLNAIVTLGFDTPGGITMGRVVGIMEGGSFEGGGNSRMLRLQCESMGSLLANDNLIISLLVGPDSETFREQVGAVIGPNHPMLQLLPDLLGPLSPGSPSEAVNTFVGASVIDVVNWILDKIPTMRIPLMGSLYGDPEPGAWFRTDQCVTSWNDARIWLDTLTKYQGSVFGFLQAALDHDFYEIFVDTAPYAPKFVKNDATLSASDVPDVFLIVRPKPFDWSVADVLPVREETGLTWPDLRTRVQGLDAHVFDLGDILTYQLGCDEREVYTYYQVTSDCELIGNSGSMAQGLAYPAIDLYLVKRHGVRPYDARLSLIGGDIAAKAAGKEDYEGEVINEITEFRNRLVNWHRYNRWLLKGSITVRGADHYRPGEPVSLPWATPTMGDELGLRLYCTAVTWSWRVGGRYECTLTLERGSNETMIRAINDKIDREGATIPGSPPHMIARA